MKIDIEEFTRIYFNKELIKLLDMDLYFGFNDSIKGSMILDIISSFQKHYFSNRVPYGHSLKESTEDIIKFDIHFNHKGTEHYMNITMYPRLIERKLKLNKLKI